MSLILKWTLDSVKSRIKYIKKHDSDYIAAIFERVPIDLKDASSQHACFSKWILKKYFIAKLKL